MATWGLELLQKGARLEVTPVCTGPPQMFLGSPRLQGCDARQYQRKKLRVNQHGTSTITNGFGNPSICSGHFSRAIGGTEAATRKAPGIARSHIYGRCIGV
jgi:hypothetical protein